MVHIERIAREKANGASVQIGIHPSKVSCYPIIVAGFHSIALHYIGGDSQAEVGQRPAQDSGAQS